MDAAIQQSVGRCIQETDLSIGERTVVRYFGASPALALTPETASHMCLHTQTMHAWSCLLGKACCVCLHPSEA